MGHGLLAVGVKEGGVLGGVCFVVGGASIHAVGVGKDGAWSVYSRLQLESIVLSVGHCGGR